MKLNEAIVKDPMDLSMELESIESDLETYGPEGFYAMSLSEFANKYPQFFKFVIMTFLKEMDILMPEDTEEELSDFWHKGQLIYQDDWACLLEGAHRMINGQRIQWEKIYKKYYKSPLASMFGEGCSPECYDEFTKKNKCCCGGNCK